MSTNRPAPARPHAPRRPADARPVRRQMGPPQKAKNFGASARRLLGLLAPRARADHARRSRSRSRACRCRSAGPKILGRATDIIFAASSAADPRAESREASHARATGDDDCRHGRPAHGIDFTALAHVLVLVMVLYVGASLFMWLQGYILNHVVQRTVKQAAHRRRREADARAARVLRRPAARRGAAAASRTTSTTSRWRCSRR